MKPGTEEFLYFLMWTANSILRPTWVNLNTGFESWAWRNGLGRRIAELERRRLIELAPENLAHAIVRLTDAGRLAALGGHDPDAQWSRAWDGRWRIVVFDIPLTQRWLHKRLWRNLRRQGFGYLQNSVWITPDPINRSRLEAESPAPNVEMVIVLESRPCAGESDGMMVHGAWDFDGINSDYQQYLSLASSFLRDHQSFQSVRQRAAAERRAWKSAIRFDPFLPKTLLPKGYLGHRAWREHESICRHLADSFSALSPEQDLPQRK